MHDKYTNFLKLHKSKSFLRKKKAICIVAIMLVLIVMLLLFFLGDNHDEIESKNDQVKEIMPIKKKKLILNFKKVSTRSALQKIANFSCIGMVISPEVTGDMSLHLEKLTWKQALKVILTTQNLSMRKIDEVMYIAPSETMASQERSEKKVEALTTLKTQLIRLNYAKAKNVADLLKTKDHALLSERGSVSVDARTNSLIIKDSSNHFLVLMRLITQLDVPVRQVMITAKIVNIDSDYEKELGVQFGTTATDGKSKKSPSADVPLLVQSQNMGHFSLALFKLGPGVLLDLELSALESEGHAEIISSPQLMTANQQSATIESGQEIPYQEKTSGGSTSVTFKKAVLSLKVTPQIIPDGRVILRLKVNQDKRSSKEVKGVPAIDTRYIETQVLVKNGQTIVLGGIFEETHADTLQRIPFFGKIPLVGALFRNRKKIDSRRELLIFITPKLIGK